MGGQKYKIAQWLKDNGVNDTLTIAQGVDIPAATVRSVLNRGEGTMFVRTGQGWGVPLVATVDSPF